MNPKSFVVPYDVNSNLTPQEEARLDASSSMKEWSDACQAIKAARNDQYPEDWWDRVMMSGIARRAEARWALSSVGAS